MKLQHIVMVVCSFLLGIVPAPAWWDTAIKAQQPIPLVEEFPAAMLPSVPTVAVRTDAQANGGQGGGVVVLTPTGKVQLRVQKQLPVSIYSLWAIARADENFDPKERPPAFFTLQVTNLQTRESRSWTMPVGYISSYEAIARLYFPVHVAGEYSLSLSLDPKSEMSFLVDRLELRDALGNTVREAVKTKRMLDPKEKLAREHPAEPKPNSRYARAAYRKINPPPPVDWPANTLAGARTLQERIVAADKLWEAVPDFNIITKPGGTAYAWIIGRGRGGLIADGAQIYRSFGDEEVAWDAAVLLAGLAEKYPALDYTVQNESNTQGYLSPDPFIFSGGHYGKYVYSGWAPRDAERLARSYDALFDYIKDNQPLADFIGTKMPWVKTPQDVIKLLDVYLLQSAADANNRRQIRGDKLSALIPLVLGPGKVADALLEQGLFGKAHVNMTDAGGIDDQIFTNFSRDGVRYIGSVGYISDELEEMASLMQQYVRAGGNPKFDLSNPELYPQVLQTQHTIAGTSVAGGFPLVIGDAQDLRRGRTHAKLPPLPSRVLGGFGAAILEDGQEAESLSAKRAVAVRTGLGVGHAHQDSLNLDITALGVRLAPDLGGRHEGRRQGSPNMRWNRVHNVVEVDEKNFENIVPGSTTSGTGWNRLFSPAPGAQVMINAARATSHPNVSLYERLTAMIDGPVTEELAPIYVFDVFRVAGGQTHTYAFHGAESQNFTTNAKLAPATGAATEYLRKHKEGTREQGKAPDVLQADWELRDDRMKSWLGAVDEKARRHTRLSLFGHAGEDVLVGNATSEAYKYDFPLLYLQKRGAEGMQSAFPAVIETYAGEPFIAAQRELKVTPNTQGARQAVAVEVTLKNGRRDTLLAGGDGDTARQVEGGLSGAGEFGFWSEDENGLRAMHLAGGTALQKDGLGITTAQAEYSGQLTSVNHAQRTFEIDISIPPAAIAGEVALLGDAAHRAEFNLQSAVATKNGTRLQVTGTPQFYQSVITRIDPGTNSVETELEPTIMRSDPVYYEGAIASNEAGTKFWKTKVVSDERWMYIAWPGYRTSWPKSISMADIPDADGDGKHTLRMIGTAKDKEKDGQVLLTLDVTRVSEDGTTLYFKMPEDEEYREGGWQYTWRKLVNEDGSKTWQSLYPGTSYRFILEGDPITEADFDDADGKRKLKIYHYGPGNSFTLPTRVAVQRVAPGEWEVRANVESTLSLPGSGSAQVKIGESDWKPLSSQPKGNAVAVQITRELLSGQPLRVRLGDNR